jgi:hypothetical protein
LERPPRSYWVPATAVAGIAVAAVGISVLLREPSPSPEAMAREAAVQDFAVAVAYLQRSALLARNEVNEAVGDGVRGAVVVSRQAMERGEVRDEQGDGDDAD